MKRLITFLLSFCMILSIGIFPTVSAESNIFKNEDKALLSTLDNEECIQLLLDYGVTIPEELKGINLQELFADLEKDPNMTCAVEWAMLANFVEAVRSVVKSYYGIEATSSVYALSSYTLQYSTLYSWDPATMPKYNCYAYAIGKTINCQPGDFSNQSYDPYSDSDISVLAGIIKDDLQGGLGYKCVKMQDSRPSSTVGWSNVIAVRKDTTYDYYNKNDYHVAKLSSSSWYHKPGGSAVLKFKSAPSNSVIWTNERYDGTYHKGDVTYDSNLKFLLYKSNHGATSYTWTGKDYHSKSRHYYLYANVCNDCGGYVSTEWTSVPCSGPPCATPWSYSPKPEVV